ncbi:replicative DNA helicase [Oceanobacillus jordanicus]|uniref:DNA 5'-3' helicase n=1 Tax=Oceanobacillus jordanicus TaxID=2867266 RepID=A0AAW5B4M2_9BACI|nr:DnaB-like helicase C-terminal domain-containing protein [Oceanobacillus jordanicus]MCG3418985.1 AAA family ATPase [Oceanobacillus jordanicus]
MNSNGLIEDLSAEQSVLGAVFLDPNVLDDIIFLEDRDFKDLRHQQIYRVMRWLEDKEQPVDVVTVTEMYVKNNRANEVSVSYFTQLAESCPTTANVMQHANIVRSKAVRRRGAEIGNKIAETSREDFDSDDEYFAAVEALATEIRPKEKGRMKSMAETRQTYFQHLTNKEVNYIETGFPQFDTWAKGVYRGDLFVSAGRPSVGKTAKLLQRTMGVAYSGPVLIWSQEMDDAQLKDRMVSNMTDIPYNKIRNKELSPRQYGEIEEAYNRLEKLPIYIQDSSGVTIEEVRATARRFKRQLGDIAMIAVDYLQIMKIPQKNGENRSTAIGNVTGAAKQIAREINCVFMMLSQMTRDSDKNPKKPTLSELKESGSIEQDADVVEFLWLDPRDTEPNGKVVQQFIAKGRNTGLNEFRLLFRGWKQQFVELDKKR